MSNAVEKVDLFVSDWDHIQSIEEEVLNEPNWFDVNVSDTSRWDFIWKEIEKGYSSEPIKRKESSLQKALGRTVYSEVISTIRNKKEGLFISVDWPVVGSEILIKNCEISNQRMFGDPSVDYLFEVRRYPFEDNDRLVIYAIPPRSIAAEKIKKIEEEVDEMLKGAVD